MSDVFVVCLSLLGGVGLGLLYFQGLWWTVVRFRKVRSPVGFYLLSSMCRMVILFAGMVFMLRIGIVPLLVAFAGFSIVRLVLVRSIGNAGKLTVIKKAE